MTHGSCCGLLLKLQQILTKILKLPLQVRERAQEKIDNLIFLVSKFKLHNHPIKYMLPQ